MQKHLRPTITPRTKNENASLTQVLRRMSVLICCGVTERMGKHLEHQRKGFSEKLLKRTRICISIPTGRFQPFHCLLNSNHTYDFSGIYKYTKQQLLKSERLISYNQGRKTGFCSLLTTVHKMRLQGKLFPYKVPSNILSCFSIQGQPALAQ